MIEATYSIRADSLNEESELIETEVEHLKARLKAITSANKDLIKVQSKLQDCIKRLDGNITDQTNQLDELSIQMSTAITGCMGSATQLMDTLSKINLRESHTTSENNEETRLSSPSEFIQSIAVRRSDIIKAHKQAASAVQNLRASLPTQVDISLKTKLFNQEIQAITDAISRGDLEELDAGLSELDDDVPNGLQVKSELELALALDHISILQAQEDILDTTIKSFKETLLPPLQEIHDNLSLLDSKTTDAEALLGALGEEFEDVLDDVERSRVTGESSQPDAEGDKLLSLVKQILASRDISRPPSFPSLALINDDDALREIALWENHAQDLDRKEAEFLSNLPIRLGELLNDRAPLLSVVYENSPSNDSPPFSKSLAATETTNSTQQKIDTLQETLAKLQKDIELMESKQVQSKLAAFVAKWRPGGKSQ
ncbi:hypothetical protein ONZ45_g5318 [Pleurotus djamor]|nr:hypothetical protein ONZ45_g5318 [Pleurotus djamor]